MNPKSSFILIIKLLKKKVKLDSYPIESFIKSNLKDPAVQSKIFSGAMGPSNMQSFYFKATENFDKEDITIATIVTSDRFPVLGRLATRYKGKV